MYPELVISCDKTSLLVEGLEHQPRHINLDLLSVLPMGCESVMVAQIVGMISGSV